jgi:hypothetical protein
MGNSNSRRRNVNVSEDTNSRYLEAESSEMYNARLLAESLIIVGEKFVLEVSNSLSELDKLMKEKVVSKITRSKMLKIVDDISKMFEQMETWMKENSPSTNVDCLQDYHQHALKISSRQNIRTIDVYVATTKNILNQICEMIKSSKDEQKRCRSEQKRSFSESRSVLEAAMKPAIPPARKSRGSRSRSVPNVKVDRNDLMKKNYRPRA